MGNKNKAPEIVKVNAAARSFRSTAVGWCTLLFDETYDRQIRESGFNPFQVCRLRQPEDHYQCMRDWAARGVWVAVESHPEIADADGVPGLDLIVSDDDQGPGNGRWLDSGSRYLDLPSGVLVIAYEPEFFEDWYLDEFPTCDASDPKTESLANSDFCDATSFKITVKPGLSIAHAYTRDLANDPVLDGRHAQLVIQLVPAERLAVFDSTDPLVGFAG